MATYISHDYYEGRWVGEMERQERVELLNLFCCFFCPRKSIENRCCFHQTISLNFQTQMRRSIKKQSTAKENGPVWYRSPYHRCLGQMTKTRRYETGGAEVPWEKYYSGPELGKDQRFLAGIRPLTIVFVVVAESVDAG